MANLGRQTRVGKLQNVGKLVPAHAKLAPNPGQHTVICNMLGDLVQRHSRRKVKQKKRREEKKKKRNGNRKICTNPVCPLAPPFSLFVFSTFVGYR